MNRWLRILLCISAAACGGARHHNYVISSVESDYSPTGRFVLSRVTERNGVMRIVVDSATVTIPGPRAQLGPPAVKDLHLSAVIATRGSVRWDAVAESDSLPLPGTWRHGEERLMRGLHFDVPLPPSLDRDKSWIVFRLSGVAMRTHFTADVRTHACSDRMLSGLVDTARVRVMRTSYIAAC